MDTTDVTKIVNQIWDSIKSSNERRKTLELVRATIPDDLKIFYDHLVDNKRSGQVREDPNLKVVVLVHGIQTDGSWQQKTSEKLRGIPKLRVQESGYEVVTAAQLVSPFRASHVNKIARDIRRIKTEEESARIYVIAHSYGSYIISKILDDHPDIRFEKIILCGSIVSRGYPWDRNARELRKDSIINDVGTRDIWPVVATFTTFGYGSSGRRGFQNASVTDRYFDYAHSDFFEESNDHIAKYWRPIIENGAIPASDWDTRKPKTSLITLIMSHPTIGRSIFFSCLAAALASLFLLILN